MTLKDMLIAGKLAGGGGGEEPSGTKQISISANGTMTENVKDYASAEITTAVPNSYTAGDEGKVVSSGALVSQSSDSVTQNGVVDTTLINSLTVNVQPAGEPELKDVVFVDYDGEVVYNYTAQEFLAMDAMPDNPSHAGLVAQGWNWSLADAKEYVQENGILVVGQNYTTDNGNTKIYLHVSEFLLENKIRVNVKPLAVANGVTIHWGDGTTTTTNSKNSTNYDHQYSEAGDYVIELESTNGKYTLGNTMESFLGGTTIYNVAPMRFIGVKKIELGSNIYQLERRAFNDLLVTTISVPADIEKMTGDSNRDTFTSLWHLKALVIPEGAYLAQSGDYFCNNARSLKFISLPKTQPTKLSDGNLSALRMLSMPASGTAQTRTGYNAWRLEKISIPGTYTNIPDNLLRYSSIKKFTIPETVTSINVSSINELPNIREYHFKSATPPTLASSNNMFQVNSDVKIYVPYSADHSILNAYKTATNWTNYASYIEEEPQ